MISGVSTTFSFSSDGRMLVAADQHYLSTWDLRDKATGNLYLLDKSTEYTAAAFSTDNHTVAYGTTNGELRLWDTSKQSDPPASIPLADQDVRSVEFSPDGHWLVASSDAMGPKTYYVAKLWDLTKGTPTLSNAFALDKNSDLIESLAFSPDSSILATGDIRGTILLWDMQHLDKSPDRISVNNPDPSDYSASGVESLALSPDKLLAVSTYGGLIWLWDLKQPGAGPTKFDAFSNFSQAEKKNMMGYLLDVRSVAFSPDGKMLVAGYGDESTHIWLLSNRSVQGELTTARVLDQPKDSRSGLTSIRFSPDGTILAILYNFGIRLWDIEQPTHTGKPTP